MGVGLRVPVGVGVGVVRDGLGRGVNLGVGVGLGVPVGVGVGVVRDGGGVGRGVDVALAGDVGLPPSVGVGVAEASSIAADVAAKAIAIAAMLLVFMMTLRCLEAFAQETGRVDLRAAGHTRVGV